MLFITPVQGSHLGIFHAKLTWLILVRTWTTVGWSSSLYLTTTLTIAVLRTHQPVVLFDRFVLDPGPEVLHKSERWPRTPLLFDLLHNADLNNSFTTQYLWTVIPTFFMTVFLLAPVRRYLERWFSVKTGEDGQRGHVKIISPVFLLLNVSTSPAWSTLILPLYSTAHYYEIPSMIRLVHQCVTPEVDLLCNRFCWFSSFIYLFFYLFMPAFNYIYLFYTIESTFVSLYSLIIYTCNFYSVLCKHEW